jgi:hypothetical protein
VIYPAAKRPKVSRAQYRVVGATGAAQVFPCGKDGLSAAKRAGDALHALTGERVELRQGERVVNYWSGAAERTEWS